MYSVFFYFYPMPHLRDVQLTFGVLLCISARKRIISVNEINFSLWDASLTVLI